MVKVHYFFDPMCGWCYGATPLIEAIEKSDKFNLIFHGGGMISRRKLDASFKHHILENDKQIAHLTGAKFGPEYLARLTGSEEVILDSFLPLQAMQAGEAIGIKPLTLLKSLQKAHYQEGKPLEQAQTLDDIASKLKLNGLNWKAFLQTEDIGFKLKSALAESKKLMREHDVNGFPTLIMEQNGNWKKLPHSHYYGKTNQWQDYLQSLSV